MRNFSDAQNVLQSALNSTNSAWEENSRYMESISAKQAQFQAQIQQFILGDGGLEALEKKLLDIGTSVMKFINDIGGLQTILTAFTTVTLVALLSNFDKLYKSFFNIRNNLTTLIGQFVEARGSGLSFSESLKMVGVSASTTQLALQGIVAVIGLVITAFTMYAQAQEEAQQAAYEAEKSALDQVNTANEQIKNLSKERQSREDLVKAIQAVDGSYKDEGQSIDELNKKRQESIDKIKEESKAELEAARESGFAQRRKDQKTLDTAWKGVRHGLSVGGYDKALEKYGGEFTGNTSEEYLAYLEKVRKNAREAGIVIDGLDKVINDFDNRITEAKTGISDYDAVLLQLGQVYDVVTGKIRALLPSEIAQSDATQQLSNLASEQIGILDEWGISIDDISEKMSDADVDAFIQALNSGDLDTAIGLLEQYGIEIENVGNETQDVTDYVAEFIGITDELQGAYETLNKAAEEYNKNGYISASTLKQLAKLQPEYIAQLDLTSGSAQVLTGALQEQFETEKQLALIHIQTAEQLDIVAYCQEYLGQETDKTTNALADDVTNAQALTTAYGQLTNAGYQAADAIATVRAEGRYDDDFEAGLNERRAKWKDYYNTVKGIELDYTSSSKGNAGSHKDAWVEAFKEEQRQLKHSLEMNEITEIEYYEKLKDLNEKYFGEVSGKHKKYLKEYQENEEEIYKGLKSVYEKVADYLADAIEQGYEDAINALKKEEKRVLAEIKAQIEALKKEKQQVLDEITNQINDLKKQKDQVLDYWNSQIDKIKEANSNLQRQNELLEKQQALQQAKAQKVMVMKDGKFQLSENESAVAQAEQALSEYQDQMSYEQQIEEMEKLRDAQVQTLEDRIEALEEYKDYMEQYYDEQIEALEQYYDEVQRQYEEQIEALQEQLDAFKKGAEQQKKIEEARLAARALGINKESELFKISLENAQKYVETYNKIMEALGSHEVPSADVMFSTASASGIDTDIGSIDTNVKHRASGDASFANDEIALVGESPNAELVIGSHLNRSISSGKLVNLSKGSGVVNAESTSTLAGLLNGIVTPTNVSNSKATTQSFNFGSISLPNVTDADSFVNTLSHKFNNYAIQYSSNRR